MNRTGIRRVNNMLRLGVWYRKHQDSAATGLFIGGIDLFLIATNAAEDHSQHYRYIASAGAAPGHQDQFSKEARKLSKDPDRLAEILSEVNRQ